MYTFSGLLRKNKEEKKFGRGKREKFVVINISDVIYIFEQESLRMFTGSLSLKVRAGEPSFFSAHK